MAATHVQYGYRRLTVLLRREGWKVSAKRVYRLYDEENLNVRITERKKIARRQSGLIRLLQGEVWIPIQEGNEALGECIFVPQGLLALHAD